MNKLTDEEIHHARLEAPGSWHGSVWVVNETDIDRAVSEASYEQGQADERKRVVAAIRSLRLRSVVLRDFLDEYGRGGRHEEVVD